ncbi:MAG: VOC family protein [Erythrobacter sp.]|nr:VOC family protein [Erythrobacter sp.]
MAARLARPYVEAGIVANDRAEALAFWHDLLGFPIEGEVSFPGLTVIRLDLGGSTLRICVPDQPAGHVAPAGGFAEATGLRYLTLYVNNLDELVSAIEAAGYPVPFPPREIRPGHRVAQVQDGRGVTLELVETAAG